MGRKFKKAAAALLVAAMFLQQCNVVSLAEADPTEMSAEAEAAAQAEAEAQAAAEAEAAAQAEAEAAAAEAAAQAEAEAQAAAEAEAAAQAEAEAQAAAEAEAAAQAEAEAQAAAEAETEQPARSSRVNAGAQITKDDLTAMLENVLPYLFVAETVTFPEIQTEEEPESVEEENAQVPETWMMEGDPAVTELAAQAWNALTLADAQSTEEVTVINLYFDEMGALDITQLYNIFEDQILDVTNEHCYVVNVIADSPEQVLDFSGFDLSENGFYLYYTESTQPCSVLYNFAAMDGEAYTDYRGTLRLWGDLQGTVLAPAANVEVEQNLAGAVYAKNITVISPEAQLQRNIYIEGEPEVIEEPETEAMTEAPAPETEAFTEAETEAPAPETEAPEPETEEPAPETEAAETEVIEAPASETEVETEIVTEAPETEAATEAPETKPETEIETEAPETEAETEVATEVLETEPETEIETEELEVINTLADPAVIDAEDKYTLKLTAEVYYNETKLTAYENDRSYSIGLFADKDGTERIGDPTELIIKKGETEGEITFESLSVGEYYVYEVKEDGTLKEDSSFSIEKMPIEIKEKDDELIDDIITETVKLIFNEYPKGEFSYDATISVKLDVIGHDDEALPTDETFYAMIYNDKDLSEEAIDEPIKFLMNGEASQEEKAAIKPTTDEKQMFYVVETDENGKELPKDSSFVYTPQYASTKNSESGNFEVEFGKDPKTPVETITNKLNDTVVVVKIEDANNGEELEESSFILIKKSTGEVITKSDEKLWEGSHKFTNDLEDDGTYYVYEVDAESGYIPVPRYEFTAARGMTTKVVLENEKTTTTNSTIAVTKSVYVDSYAVYATSSHLYYLALFDDADHTEKVSNVEKVNVGGFTGAMSFVNVVPGKTYYVAETDKYGIALSASDPSVTITPDNGKVRITENTNHQMEMKNTYSYLPEGYYYTGQLTLTKEVMNSSNSAINVSDTFYIGLYKNSDYSGTPRVIKIGLNNASSESVKSTFWLENGSLTYYIQEVKQDDNKNWVPVSDISDYPYTSSVSQLSVTITKDSINNNIPNVTVTNTEKVVTEDSGPKTDVELYLTKRVYEGSNHHETNDTFYVGLFMDKAMTELYPGTEPIAMKMAGQEDGELTLKITMSVSESTETDVYVAEVHADGTPVTESQYQSFGYEIGSEQPIPVEFIPSQGQDKMRAVILNGVYGTMTAEGWQNIYDEIEDLYGDDDEIGLADDLEEDAEENGLSTVQTADNTPVAGTMALMAAALVVLGFSIRRRRRAS